MIKRLIDSPKIRCEISAAESAEPSVLNVRLFVLNLSKRIASKTFTVEAGEDELNEFQNLSRLVSELNQANDEGWKFCIERKRSDGGSSDYFWRMDEEKRWAETKKVQALETNISASKLTISNMNVVRNLFSVPVLMSPVVPVENENLKKANYQYQLADRHRPFHLSSKFPVSFINANDGINYALYKDTLWFSRKTLDIDGWRTLIDDRLDRENRKLKGRSSPSNGRDTVTSEVRIAVWRRDQGKCVRCHSRERLEYDHIIPVSKGGSNTERNIELLCEACNRAKSDAIR
jgi:HNH endonuclease